MKFLTTLCTLFTVTLMLNACSSSSPEKLATYKDEKPTMYLEEYFNGPVKAYGTVHDFRGNVTRRFQGDLYGVWDGKKGDLYEVFRYYDGEVYKRVWNLNANPEGGFSGTAYDIIGEANGNQSGNAVFWKYVMEVPVGDKTYNLSFDDRMWLMKDGVLINNIKMKKFGITVGYVTVVMEKLPEGAASEAHPDTYKTIEAKR